MCQPTTLEKAYKCFAQWKSLIAAQPGLRNAESKTIFWQLLFNDLTPQTPDLRRQVTAHILTRSVAADSNKFWKWWHTLKEQANAPAGETNPVFNMDGASSHGIVHDHVMTVTCGRRLIMGQGRHIGLGPAETQHGDIVCVLFGGKLPFVLRPTETPREYEYVGNCYVHGIMGGEALIEQVDRGSKSRLAQLLGKKTDKAPMTEEEFWLR